ncbi:MAG: ubiquinone/menaquinone biosynthesis methyltransferase, partial [Planctomycetota bacterium]
MTKGDKGENSPPTDGMPETACGGSSENAVGKMFDRIAPTYALLNHILSFGLDFSWRRRLAESIEKDRPIELLDLATGSGDLLISILRRRANISKATGLDISEKMLEVCRRNLEKAKLAERATPIQADAARTGLADNSFDAATMAFGIRNVPEPNETLAEIFRVLRPGGEALILEFSLPSNRLVRGIYLVYLRRIVPFIGRVIS